MALRSKEFVGKAEGIKSHELSVKSLIGSLKGTLSKLGSQKQSIENRISYLYAELAAAENDTDEDGEPDYGLIASIESQIDQANDELDDTEQEISDTSGELEKAEKEFEQVEEEKQQTLFEIQQRARTTSQNLSSASSMYGAYADVGASLNQSFQASFDALAQAAAILDGSVGSTGGASHSGGSTNTHSGNGVGIGGATGATAAILGASHIAATNQHGMYRSNQSSVRSHSSRGISPNKTTGSNTNRGSSLRTSQLSVAQTTSRALSKLTTSNNNLRSTQSSHSEHSDKQNKAGNIDRGSSSMKVLSSSQSAHIATNSIAVAKKTLDGNNSQSSAGKQYAGASGPTLRVGRNPFTESLIVQDWELGRYSDSSMASLRRNAAKSDYEAFLKAPENYHHISYTKKPVVYVDPASILGIRGANDPGFWAYKNTSYANYVDMARQIPLVYAMAKAGQKLTDLAKRDDVIGACARNYFLNDDITAMRVGNSFIFGDEGRHRVMAALIAGVNIPIRLTDEMVINDNSSSIEKKTVELLTEKERSERFRQDFAKLSSTVSQKIAHANEHELIDIVKNEQIAQKVSFGDMDINVARELVDTIWKAKSQFSFLEFPYIGSTQVLNSNLRENISVNLTRLYVQNNPSASIDEIAKEVEIQTNAYMERFKIDKDDLAVSISIKKPAKIDRPKSGFETAGYVTEYVGDTFSSKLNGISINTDNAKSHSALCEQLKIEEQRGSSPKGCNTVQYLVYHEIAHQLDSVLQLSKDPEIIKEYINHANLSTDLQKNNLCTYASKNIHEFIAEAWAESQCSTTPRRVAVLIRDKISAAATEYVNAKKGADDYVREHER